MWSLCCAVLLSCALSTAASGEDAAPAGAAAAAARAAEPELAHVEEGCQYIGETQICITGNVTGTVLHVQCTAENFPLGEDVNIYLHYDPFIDEHNEYKLPLNAGCSFKEWEIAKYTCSFKTDTSQFTSGTMFQCVFNGNYLPRPFFTKTNEIFESSKYRSEARRPEALLNCQYRMGEPALAWSLGDVYGGTSNLTLFTPNTRLKAFCVLACHDQPTRLDDWELVWTLGDRVLNYTAVSDRRVESLTLDYNLMSEDDGKHLKCILRNCLENGSLQELQKLSATLATNTTSTYSDWLFMAVIAVLLLFIYALIGVSDRQRGEQEDVIEQRGAQEEATALPKDVGINAQDFQIEIMPSREEDFSK